MISSPVAVPFEHTPAACTEPLNEEGGTGAPTQAGTQADIQAGVEAGVEAGMEAPTADAHPHPHRQDRARPPVRLPASAEDLTRIYQALQQTCRLPSGPRRSQQLEDIAWRIAYCPYLHLPGDPDSLAQAHKLNKRMNQMLDGTHLRARRPLGVQVALDEFAVRLDDALRQNRGSRCRPQTLRKSVPLAHPLSTSTRIDVGVMLAPVHPAPPTRVAATPDADAPSRHHPGPTLQQPLLSIKSLADGLQLSTSPQVPTGRPMDDASHAALARLQTALVEACRSKAPLAAALERFNQDVGEGLRLQLSPGLAPGTATAPLRGTPSLRRERQVWFDYLQLAAPSGLDALVEDPLAKSCLDLCRAQASKAVEAAMAQFPKSRSTPSQAPRLNLMTGCAVQLCIESTQWRAQPGTHFRFRVPASEVMARMTRTEKTLMREVIHQLRGIVESPDTPPIGWADPGHGTRTYVSLASGDPMGCLLLQQDGGRPPVHSAHALSLAHLGRRVAPHHSPSAAAQRWRPHPSFLRFDQLQPLRLQPAWTSELGNCSTHDLAGVEAGVEVGVEAGDWTHESAHGAVHDSSHDSSAFPSLHSLLHSSLPLSANGSADHFASADASQMNELLADLRRPGHWRGFSAELAPRFVTDCPGWPTGRALDVHHADSGSLLHRSAPPNAARTPVRIARMPKQEHYAAVVGDRMLDIPADGDCFYAAVLAAMQPDERAALLQQCACPPHATHHVRSAALALRQHFAAHLDLHSADYRDQIHQLRDLLG